MLLIYLLGFKGCAAISILALVPFQPRNSWILDVEYQHLKRREELGCNSLHTNPFCIRNYSVCKRKRETVLRRCISTWNYDKLEAWYCSVSVDWQVKTFILLNIYRLTSWRDYITWYLQTDRLMGWYCLVSTDWKIKGMILLGIYRLYMLHYVTVVFKLL